MQVAPPCAVESSGMAFLPPPKDWSLGDIAMISGVGGTVSATIVFLFDRGAQLKARDYLRVVGWSSILAFWFALMIKVTIEWGVVAGIGVVIGVLVPYWAGMVYADYRR